MVHLLQKHLKNNGMKIVVISLLAICVMSNPLSPFKWKNRVLLVFSESQEKITKQKTMWFEDRKGLEGRDLVIFEFNNKHGKTPDHVMLKAKQVNWFYDNYNSEKLEFKVLLIGKDGGVKLEETDYLSKQKLFSTIDAMPMRQREMKKDN